MVATVKFRHVAMKCDIILIRCLAGRLAGGGPEVAVFVIVQIYPQAAGIAHGIGHKTGQGLVPPLQPAAASGRDRRGQAAIAKQLGLRVPGTKRWLPFLRDRRRARPAAGQIHAFQSLDL